MRIEQKFLRSDLNEVGQIFSKSMEPKIPIFKRGNRWNKMWKYLLMIISFLLFGCSIILFVLEHTFSMGIKVYVFVGIIGVLTLIVWNYIEKKTEPMEIVKRKYGEPFSVEMKKDALLYKEIEIFYVDISTVVEYKNFLFIKADKKWLVIKADKAEKSSILSKINEKTLVRLIEKKDVFDLRQIPCGNLM